jgi:type II secretory ATPase GspE/PulE/Tfp pilus assembly ATPase PilB-like protein
VTIEDPIEYDMKYVNQTQVNPAQGITFATGLREIVRQDPNIIMVGEIRDGETADIAVQSALTGHLVLSTLHTNDAPTAIPRLLDLKVLPFLAAAVLNLIVAQRLVRRICLTCITSYKPDAGLESSIESQLTGLHAGAVRIPKLLYKGAGCPACGGTGYKGRLGIYEMLEVTEDVRRVIADPAFTLDKLYAAAETQRMTTMFQDGLRKAERGLTTVEEILRVMRE